MKAGLESQKVFILTRRWVALNELVEGWCHGEEF